MKILYCIGSLTRAGGAERVLANKANYFAEVLGYEIHILINDQFGGNYAFNFSSKIKLYDMKISSYLPKRTIPYFSYKLLQKKMKKIYKKKILNINPDIIIVVQHGIDDYIIPKLKLGIPVVREFHFAKKAVYATASLIQGFIAKQLFLFRKEKLLQNLNNYDHLVLLTNKDQSEGNYQTNTTVIPNMLDFSSFPNSRPDYNNKRVISVGSMHDMRKGFDVQIRLWQKVLNRHPEWKLDIYGDGKIREDLQRLINNLNLNHSVTLHGNSDRIQEKYFEASFYLCTSMAEGLPMVLIEAMSCGLPCISFDCPEGPSDIIQNNVNGILVENGNVEQLFDKLDYMMSNVNIRESMGKNAKERSKDYSFEKIATKWMEFFKSIRA